MAAEDLTELTVLQIRLTEEANIFLAYFGVSKEVTFSRLDQAYKNLPNSLSLGITVELPSQENIYKALDMEKSLSPLVQIYSGLIDCN